MSPFWIPIVAMLIPIIGMLMAFGNKWLKLKEKMIEAERGLAIEKAAQYAAQTEALEARVRVLERIVTDRGYDVASAIEALRDGPDRPLVRDAGRPLAGQIGSGTAERSEA